MAKFESLMTCEEREIKVANRVQGNFETHVSDVVSLDGTVIWEITGEEFQNLYLETSNFRSDVLVSKY